MTHNFDHKAHRKYRSWRISFQSEVFKRKKTTNSRETTKILICQKEEFTIQFNQNEIDLKERLKR